MIMHMTPHFNEPSISHQSISPCEICSAAGSLIGIQQVGKVAEAANPVFSHSEAPGIDTGPGDVLARVTDMGQFPVEDGCKAVFVDHQVAKPEIAMHEHRRKRAGRIGAQPLYRQFEYRSRRLEAAIDLLIRSIWSVPKLSGSSGRLAGCRCRESGQGRTALGQASRAGPIRVVAQNARAIVSPSTRP